jgi:hypothetical protein
MVTRCKRVSMQPIKQAVAQFPKQKIRFRATCSTLSVPASQNSAARRGDAAGVPHKSPSPAANLPLDEREDLRYLIDTLTSKNTFASSLRSPL